VACLELRRKNVAEKVDDLFFGANYCGERQLKATLSKRARRWCQWTPQIAQASAYLHNTSWLAEARARPLAFKRLNGSGRYS
jgi:hypothetical protein